MQNSGHLENKMGAIFEMTQANLIRNIN